MNGPASGPAPIEAEQAVLGALMLAPDTLDKVADRLSEDDFYRKDHRQIWRAINELANKGMPCDAVTLGDWIQGNGLAEMVGGASYLIDLANSTPSAANIAAYAEIVHEHAERRRLGISLARATADVMQQAAATTRGALQVVIEAAPAVADNITRVNIPALGEILPPIDFVLPGLEAGSVGMIVGAGAAGKTMLAIEIAVSIASGHPIAQGPAGALFGGELQRGNVTLVCGEDSPTIVAHRLAAVAEAYGLTQGERDKLNAPGVLTVVSAVGTDLRCLTTGSGRRGGCAPGPFLPRLRQLCFGRRLVIVDPLAFLHDAEESSNGEMTQLMRLLARVARCSHTAIIVIHHAKKPSGAGTGDAGEDWACARGASALTTASRVQYFLRAPREKERKELGIKEDDAWRWCLFMDVKTNYTAQAAPAWLRRGRGGVLERYDPASEATAEEYAARRDGHGGRAGGQWGHVRRGRVT